MKVQITLKSGAQLVVDVDRFELGYDGPTDTVRSVKWKHAQTSLQQGGGNLLAGVVRSEIAAVVFLDAHFDQTPDLPADLVEVNGP